MLVRLLQADQRSENTVRGATRCSREGKGKLAGGYLLDHIIETFPPDREQIPGKKLEGLQWCAGVWPTKAEC